MASGASRSKSARVQAIGPGGPGERGIAEGGDQRSPQTPVRAGDGDAHQPADRNRDPYCRS